jgi:2-polyprenyl-3-methyl-5-hydroxy-6-metoxy-1,4-benzoquinol methylase
MIGGLDDPSDAAHPAILLGPISAGNKPPPRGYTSPMNQKNFPETADIDTASDDYATRFSGPIGEWLLQVQEDATARMLADYPGARVLDVGGGHGQLTPYLVRNGFDVTVTGSADICSRRLEPYLGNGECAFALADHLDLPYEDRSFDVVLSYRLLTHVNRWQELVAELSRVAERAVVVDFSSVRSFNYIAPQLFKFKKRVEKNTRPFTCYKEADLLEAFAASGFERGDRYPQFSLPMAFHRMVGWPGFSSFKEGALRGIGFTSVFGSPVVLKMVRR